MRVKAFDDRSSGTGKDDGVAISTPERSPTAGVVGDEDESVTVLRSGTVSPGASREGTEPGRGLIGWAVRSPVAFTTVAVLASFLAFLLGRLTRQPGSTLSLVWPVVAVNALWLLIAWGDRGEKRPRGALVVGTVAVPLVSAATQYVTGGTVRMLVPYALTTLINAVGLAWIYRRYSPAQGPRLTTLMDLVWVGIASVASATVGALAGPGIVALTMGGTLADAVGNALRNASSAMLLVPLGLIALSGRRRTGKSAGPGEVLALLAATVVMSLSVFVWLSDKPLTSLLLATSVWAGLRLSARPAALFLFVTSTAATLLVINGMGPMGKLEPRAAAMVMQAFLVVTGTATLVLVLYRTENARLMAEVESSEALAAQRARFMNLVIDNISEGVLVADLDGRIRLQNPASKRLLGRGRLDTQSWVERYGITTPTGEPIAEEALPVHRALAGETVTDAEVLVTPSGSTSGGRLLQIQAAPFDDGEERQAALVFRDITDERRRLDELKRFAGVVAHDLRAPLGALRMWTEELEDRLGDPEPGIADCLGRINGNADRMVDMVNDFLKYSVSRDGKLHPRAVSIAEIAADVTVPRRTAGPEGRVPRFAIGEDRRVMVDPTLLRQLLDNLVSNAIKYSVPGTDPDVAIWAEDDSQEGWVRVNVRDRGIGVPEGQESAVFQEMHRVPEHRDKAVGTGLGLAICRRIVHRHGGVISVRRNAAGGSTFTFTLPAA